ncbi:MAG: hypothetical protein NT154_31180 [Verrucomicrobia bacterium]|nr:hypothetical protein [Verrucomicrobiota bacterium]
MNHFVLAALPLCLVLASAFSQTNRLPDPAVDSPYRVFLGSLKAATEGRDFVALRALYQTNGISAEELDVELAHWRSLLDEKGKDWLPIEERGCIFRELSKANKMWSEMAEQSTTHKATYLVEVFSRTPYATGHWLFLPLVKVDGRFLIVPSDKKKLLSGMVHEGHGP